MAETPKQTSKILILDDDVHFSKSLKRVLEDAHYEVTAVARISDALDVLKANPPDVMLLDLILRGERGIDLLLEMRNRTVAVPVIALTAVGQVASVVEVIRAGATNYLVKPVDFDELVLAIESAKEHGAIREEVGRRRHLQVEANRDSTILGTSAAIGRVRQDIDTVAPTDAAVLVTGETGTGKELVARAIHAVSPRARAPFVAINCGAIPGELIEAEFYGYQKGAFTGAQSHSIGKMRLAHGGTLLLDEVGELPLAAQVKLLRSLEEKEFYPVGSSELVRIDIRVVASTNRDLREMIKEGTFRKDLYFRLNVFEITIPPLRHRVEDVIVLARHFIEQFSRKLNKEVRTLSVAAEKILARYPWEGNVRELRNVIERQVLTSISTEIDVDHLSMTLCPPPRAETGEFVLPAGGLDLDEHEKILMQQALQQVGGNKAKAAKLLKMSKATFYYRADKYGL
jgi:DNA-binding NtrC family response regulator